MKYRIIGWTDSEDERYPEASDEYYDELRDEVIRELRRCGYRFGGDSHEFMDCCTPVFNTGEKFSVSSREWGAIMAQALREDNTGGMAYIHWYTDIEMDDEEIVLPPRGVDDSLIEGKDTPEGSERLNEEPYYAGIRNMDDYAAMLKRVYEFAEKENLLFCESGENETAHPLIVNMKLHSEYFEKLKNGSKTVEIRLMDKKRRRLAVGDTVQFIDTEKSRHMRTRITRLHCFDNFKSLIASPIFPKCGFGNSTPEEALIILYSIYSQEDELQYGVVGIELEVISAD